jgi:hypothetical protein
MALIPAQTSVPYRDPGDDVVIVRFKPTDPVGMTEVEIDGPFCPVRTLALIEETAIRLVAYARDYRAASAQDRGNANTDGQADGQGDPDDAGDYAPDDDDDADTFAPRAIFPLGQLDHMGRN